MNYTDKTLRELKTLCRERKIKGFSSKKSKEELIQFLQSKDVSIPDIPSETQIADAQITVPQIAVPQQILLGDTLTLLPTLASDSAQIILADPPYNIGKDFGNNSDKQPMDEYLIWCEKWIHECLRILKPNGTMFLYGFSEILALILSKVPYTINRRWIIWHYTNKNIPSLHFWQRSHESILVLWKSDKVFHRDDISSKR